MKQPKVLCIKSSTSANPFLNISCKDSTPTDNANPEAIAIIHALSCDTLFFLSYKQKYAYRDKYNYIHDILHYQIMPTITPKWCKIVSSGRIDLSEYNS